MKNLNKDRPVGDIFWPNLVNVAFWLVKVASFPVNVTKLGGFRVNKYRLIIYKMICCCLILVIIRVKKKVL
jgi:hypothetical protein